MRWILLLALITSCAKPQPKPSTTPTPPIESKKEAPVSALTITTTNVGPLSAGSSATLESVAELLPDYQVAATKRTIEGESLDVLEVKRDEKIAFVIEPNSKGTIFRISITDATAKGPDGIQIGLTYAEFSQKLPEHECFRLTDNQANAVACYDSASEEIGYVFGSAAENFEGPAGTVPPKPAMATAALTEFLWVPNAE